MLKKNNKILVFIQIIVSQIALCVFKILFRFNVSGGEILKELEDGPIIFASNHNSYIDGGIAGASLLESNLHIKKFFPIKYLVSEKYFKWKYFPINIFIMLTGSIRINKALKKELYNKHLFQVLSEPIKALKNANKIWIYPQGGFNNDGSSKKARHGVIFLHQQTKAPIVPVKIIGNEKVMSVHAPFLPTLKTLMMFNRIDVIFGKPIYALNTQDIDQGTKILMDKIKEIT